MIIASKCASYCSLVKLKLSLLVLFSGIVGLLLASGTSVKPFLFLAFCIGSLCVIGGANAFNEIIERHEDALMKRTESRPIPQNKIKLSEARIAAITITAAGLCILFLAVNPITSLLAAIAFLLYVFAYTPAKKKGAWCTVVGAFPGAIPAMMGPAAVSNAITPLGWLMFGIVFLWQFPHFFAIAWLSKEDYQRAGFRIFPVPNNDPNNERLLAYGIIFTSSLLVAVSPLLTLMNHAGSEYFFGSLALSLLLLGYAIRFWFKLSRPLASQLMRVALAYLPFLFILMLVDKVTRPS